MTTSVEIIVTHSRRKLQICYTTRVGGHSSRYFNPRTWRHTDNHLSVSDHVRYVISRFAQSPHALRILRCHVMSSDALKTVYKSVVLAKLLYAAPAWWSFTNTADKDRIEAFLRRGVKLCLYQDTDPTASQLVEDLEHKLFRTVLYNTQHVLHHLLPNRTDH